MLGESPEGSQVEEEETGCEGSCVTRGSGVLATHESAEAHTQFSVAGCCGEWGRFGRGAVSAKALERWAVFRGP